MTLEQMEVYKELVKLVPGLVLGMDSYDANDAIL